MTPQASIIIPCYNIAPHLGKCIDSLLVQIFTDFELILVNDGSTDDTGAVCDLYAKKDHRIRVFHKENGGVSAARNLGIEKSVGELILFIDGDDYVKLDYVAQLVNGYADGVWPICGMINVRKGIEEENENYKNLLLKYLDENVSTCFLLVLLKHNVVGTPCARVYAAKIIKQNKILFDEKITYQEDLVFDLAYVKYIKSFKLINYFGYFYVEHPSSSTGRYHKLFNQIDEIYHELIKYIHTKSDEIIAQEFILQTYLRKIGNVFHKNSTQNIFYKHQELKKIFMSESFLFGNTIVDKLEINFLLKWLLKKKSVIGVLLYFKILH